MKRNFYIGVCIAAALAMGGCRKYVEIKTQGNLVPGEMANYRYLLNNSGLFETGAYICDFASDDAQLVDGSTQQVTLASNDFNLYWTSSYTWQSVIYPAGGSYYHDYNWNYLYNAITNANIVITEVPSASDGTAADKNALIAEALVHRADAYLSLVNLYGKPYQQATAAGDLGVPLVLKETTEQPLIRASVQDTYNQVIADLKQAIPSLPVTQSVNMLPSLPSAFGVLARCYLYMNLYDSAALYADSALAYRSTLNDLSTITTVNNATYPLRKADPEILLSKTAYNDYGTTGSSQSAIRLSDTLLSVLTPTDKRYQLFTVPATTVSASYAAAGGRFFYKSRYMLEARNTGVSVPEMMLIKAEAYARKGDAVSAVKWVNALRVKRFATADYVAVTAANADEALVQVVRERQREFFCRMLRWWDMRRLNAESRFQHTLTRVYSGVTYTLAPSSNRYVFPISEYNRQLNPEIAPNP